MSIYRGDIYFVELGPTRGREIDLKKRPALVISINDINEKPLVVSVIPGGTRKSEKPVYRHEVLVQPTSTNGLRDPTVFQCFQIKAIDKTRFPTQRAGVISSDDLRKVEETVKLCLGLV